MKLNLNHRDFDFFAASREQTPRKRERDLPHEDSPVRIDPKRTKRKKDWQEARRLKRGEGEE